MRIAIVIAMCVATVVGCATARPPPVAHLTVTHTAQPPFDDEPISFVVAAPRFTPGEVAIVKVCLAADRSILSAAVMESSGDRRFDDLALTWARQVGCDRRRTMARRSRPAGKCGWRSGHRASRA